MSEARPLEMDQPDACIGTGARLAVVVIGVDGVVRHTELVPEITDEPDYDAALAVLG